MPATVSVTLGDPDAATANAAVLTSKAADGGGIEVPTASRGADDLHVAPFTFTSRKRTVLDALGVRILPKLTAGQILVTGTSPERHEVRNLYVTGTGTGIAIAPPSQWRVYELHAVGLEAAVKIIDDKCVFDGVTGKDLPALFKVDAGDKHGGGQRITNARMDGGGAFVDLVNSRMESWIVRDSTISGAEWVVRRLIASKLPFMSRGKFDMVGAEFLRAGTFYDPAGTIDRWIFDGQSPTMERNATPPPPSVKAYKGLGNELHGGSIWLPGV